MRHRDWFDNYHEYDCYNCRWWKEEALSFYSVFYKGSIMTAAHFFIKDIYVMVHFVDDRNIIVEDYGVYPMKHLFTMSLDNFEDFNEIHDVIKERTKV